MQGKKVLVTGAGGFVGRSVVYELISRGYRVYAMLHTENASLFSEIASERLVKIVCAMEQIETLTTQIPEQIEVCIHLAWCGSAGELRKSYEQQMINVDATRRLIETCSRMGCRRFIYAGSIMEYEIHKALNVPGYQPAQSGLYSVAKLAADQIGKITAVNLGMEYLTAVISNIYGPGEKSPRLINTIVHKLQQNEKVALTEGTQLYDFIYIDDAANAFAEIAEKGINCSSYYIGNRKQQPLRAFLEQVGRIMGKEQLLEFGKISFDAAIALQYDELDTQRLYQDTDFESRISFEEGIRKLTEGVR